MEKQLTPKNFNATAEYTSDKMEIVGFNSGSEFSYYLMAAIGLAYQHPLRRSIIQHTLSTTFAIPVIKESTSILIPEKSDRNLPPSHIDRYIVDGAIDHSNGRNNFLFGLEYQAEWLFNIDKPVFFGPGLVFNYSWGITGNGVVTVDNGRTAYYGAIFQEFSKIGLTLRMGWNFLHNSHEGRK